MALKDTQDDDLSVNQNHHHTQSLFLSTWMATQKPRKRSHVQMILPMEKGMRRMIAIQQLMVMIEASITSITIVTLLHLFEIRTHLIHMSLHLIAIVITITITATKPLSPTLFLPLVLQHGIPLIQKQLSIYLIDSMLKAVNCQRRGIDRLQTQLTTCCRTFFHLDDHKSVQQTGCGNLFPVTFMIFSHGLVSHLFLSIHFSTVIYSRPH
jgi:hypothetical protein